MDIKHNPASLAFDTARRQSKMADLRERLIDAADLDDQYASAMLFANYMIIADVRHGRVSLDIEYKVWEPASAPFLGEE